MGRIDTSTDEQVGGGGVEFHEADGAPPPMEDDLYEPPPHYHHPSTNQRSTPPPQPFPPPQHDPPPPPPAHHFPPPQDPMHPASAHVHHFPPPQDPMHPAAAAHVHHFPPPQDPMHPAAHHFPPPQDPMHPAAAAPHHFPPPPDKPPMGQPFTPSPPPQQQHFPSNFTNANPYIHHQQQPQNFQQGIPMGLQHTQPWNTHLFDCMKNPQNAIITLFFPCVTFGQIAEILDSGSTSCGTSGMLYSLIACCIAMPCIMSCTYRSKFGLIESPAPDWAIHCFCECCALCQEYRELEERGFDPSIGWMGNVAKQQQKQQQFGMTPPMQQRMF